ncbi:aldehyde ferredoxin oxidoreductase [Desulfovibrio aminophilus]|nr:aldehyde ferredoxin oxidoreductase C-terminal domain-containing protein [Desulfovibrio aminophilus]MCM0755724.1 aldehyde ferredoxin oxidoreductase [Desulfovibrio aminophilus]
MIRDHFRVLVMDLAAGKGKVAKIDGRDEVAGGSGLAALLFNLYGRPDRPWDDPAQPFILAIGPLTGYFPLMSKTVAAFKSPYHDQYAESHAGGRSALALRFADYDALVLVGRAARPAVLVVGSRRVELRDAQFLWGMDALGVAKRLRQMSGGSGHRSILRIGPAGENRSALACINVDTYRHFGRLGSGAVLGAKNVKAVAIRGDADFPFDQGGAACGGAVSKDYPKLFKEIHRQLTDTQMMSKYHNLGTAGNVAALNELKSLPWRNLQQTADPKVEGISGERFAEETLLRNAACAGCPVGCVHIGFVREKFMADNRWLYRQVSYDYELIFAVGSMLGVTSAFDVLRIVDAVEKQGLDVMGAGVALAWATEALEKGLVTPEQALEPLAFGDADAYARAVEHLGRAANEFYRDLGRGALVAADKYGGADFACVLGQEMAGYATGELYFVAQALGFRHSHLDSAAYSWDQKHDEKDVDKGVEFLVADESGRSFLTSMVSCLFARGVYKDELLAQALESVGYTTLARNMAEVGEHIRRLRWRTRFATGFNPEAVRIPKRFTEVSTWKGPVDPAYMEALRLAYAKRLRELGKPLEDETPA